MIQNLYFSGDTPEPRFGHSLTLVDSNYAVLYGGAVGPTSNFVLTADTYLCDLKMHKWKKLQPSGIGPGIRAAHGACSVEGMLVIFGGALKSGQLADDQIYILQLKRLGQSPSWSVKQTNSLTPGRRYGHCMSYVKTFIAIFGGNMGNTEPVNDAWIIDMSKSDVPQKPLPRVYHYSSVCLSGRAKGMMVIFGGRSGQPTTTVALNDAWGLRMHNKGDWDWVLAPYLPGTQQPAQRYQHSAHFLGPLMLIIGGRVQQHDSPIQIYNTLTNQWHKMNFQKFQSVKRFRHASFAANNSIYIYGGFQQSEPVFPTSSFIKITFQDDFLKIPVPPKITPVTREAIKSTPTSEDIRPLTNDQIKRKQIQSQQRSRGHHSSSYKPVRLCNLVVESRCHPQNQQMILIKRPIDQLAEERKRLVQNFPAMNYQSRTRNYTQILQNICSSKSVSSRNMFNTVLSKEILHALITDSIALLSREPSLLRLRPPAKIFGDLYGQFMDLQSLFHNFGWPSDLMSNGDIDSFDYIFLGNITGYGTKCLQTLFLLLTLKLVYPQQIHLIRGSQEDYRATETNGFAEECAAKLNQNTSSPSSVYQRLIKVFQYMPLAVLLDDKILCVHRGIGNTMQNVSQIDKIQRPLEIIPKPKSASDVLVSQLLSSQFKQTQKSKDPYDYSPQRLQKFIIENGLNFIIRGSDTVAEGFQILKFILSVCSCSDVRGLKQNRAAVLIIKKNCEIMPKSIKGMERQGRWTQSKKKYIRR